MPTLPHDALVDALGRIVADHERQLESFRALQEAQWRAFLAEWEAKRVALEDSIKSQAENVLKGVINRIEGKLADTTEFWTNALKHRLEQMKDGEAGPQGERGEPGEPGQPGRDGVDGKDGESGRDGLDGKDGRDGVDGRDGTDGQPGRDGIDGRPGLDGRDGLPGVPGRDGAPGPQGERGERGEPGERGSDGLSVRPLGKFDLDGSYRALDMVTWDGTWWLAKSDTPGVPGEGDGWMVLPRPKKGDKGDRGEPGKPGKDGMSFVAARVDEFTLVLIREDGETVSVDLEPSFRAYHDQVTR